MIYRENFSEILKELRKSKKVSLASLGEVAGISNQAISLLEQGKRSPSFEVLIALADYFNVSLDYLVGRSDEPERR